MPPSDRLQEGCTDRGAAGEAAVVARVELVGDGAADREAAVAAAFVVGVVGLLADLHSFPARRSSDLVLGDRAGRAGRLVDGERLAAASGGGVVGVAVVGRLI